MTLGTSTPLSATGNASPVEPATASPGIALRSVTKMYSNAIAVENLTLDIPAGSYCCLLGPSGCGKTTTLRMLAGHEAVSSGEIWMGDRRVDALPPAKRDTAMVFQNYALFPHKSVRENVGFGLKMRGVAKRERAARVAEMLALVGLAEFGDRRPTQLSGGQQQRVALARALATRPQVLLLDEPLSALDESLRVKTRSELRKLQRQFGLTFVQVTHAQDEAFSLADFIVVMDHGRVDQVGTAAAVYHQPASVFVADFVGDNNIFAGQVLSCEPVGDRERVQLAVEGVGSLVATGAGGIVGHQAACCVRADQMQLAVAIARLTLPISSRPASPPSNSPAT